MIKFIQSSIGKKVIVAFTGVVLLGFVIGHLAGNLQVFLGPEKLNAYSDYLHHAVIVLWGTRIVLLISVLLHIVFTIQLTRMNRASRPLGYVKQEPIQANLPSRLMIWSGAFLGFYIVYHLLHFTFGTAHPHFQPNDVYANVIVGFSSVPVSLIYIVAMICLGLHLFHGIWSVFQTLGLNHPNYNQLRRIFSVGASIIITLGYISIPVAVLLGVVH